MLQGLITKGLAGFYYVKTAQGEYECKARGVYRKKTFTPQIGDRVDITVIDEEKKEGVIESFHERTSSLIRPPVANIEQLFIVFAAKNPLPDLELVDKLIIMALKNNLKPILIINKTDLDEAMAKEYSKQYSNLGLPIICNSCIDESNSAIDEIKQMLKNKISSFAGQSGVGKSSLLNKIFGKDIMETGDLSIKKERGKHTTRHAEIFELDFGGYIVDTPGFSSYELVDILYNELWQYYPEILRVEEPCKFTGCLHMSEPECAVKALIEQGLFHPERYERYCNFVKELKTAYDNRYR